MNKSELRKAIQQKLEERRRFQAEARAERTRRHAAESERDRTLAVAKSRAFNYSINAGADTLVRDFLAEIIDAVEIIEREAVTYKGTEIIVTMRVPEVCINRVVHTGPVPPPYGEMTAEETAVATRVKHIDVDLFKRQRERASW